MNQVLERMKQKYSRGIFRYPNIPIQAEKSAKSGRYLAILKDKTSSEFHREDARVVLARIITDLPTSSQELLSSSLFDEYDLKEIATGAFVSEGLRMYIASWLIANRRFPFVLHDDWRDRLDLGRRNSHE